MSKSDYTYELKTHARKQVLMIMDLNLGNMSVTNNIENVVDEICAKEAIKPGDYMIVYMDSHGYWDGYKSKDKSFVILRTLTYEEALTKYTKIENNLKNNFYEPTSDT